MPTHLDPTLVAAVFAMSLLLDKFSLWKITEHSTHVVALEHHVQTVI